MPELENNSTRDAKRSPALESSRTAGLLDPLSQGTGAGRLTGDLAWLQALVDAELGLTRALIRAGLVPLWMRGIVDDLSDAGTLDLVAIAEAGRAGGNPVMPLVKALGRAAEERRAGASDHIHVGATSQDILDSAAMLVAHRVTAAVADALADLAGTLAALAARHRTTPMAGRTLGQQASPTSFGLVVAGWLDAVVTARERVEAVRDALPVQLGGAVGNLAVLGDIVAARQPSADPQIVVDTIIAGYAATLGLRAPVIPWHANRLPITELGDALAGATGAVGAFALDVTVLARTEIGELSEQLADGEGGSSAMPHKRNPVTAFLVVAAARRAPGLLSTLHGSLLAEDQRPSGAWHAEWPTLRDLGSLTVAATESAASLAARLDVDAERMRANLELTDGLIFSERVSTILGEALGKRAAFELVEAAARESVATHRPLRVVLSARLVADGHPETLRAAVWNAFDPDAALGNSGPMIDAVLARERAQRDQTRREEADHDRADTVYADTGRAATKRTELS
ncbi:lyase family protein [Rathayibacter soli]|uniref:lyase family protein n=1 Tax=Rathayibacter soli TaxID=3144168 RepID=UPI0027E3DA44|nr:lyase family protein [Glaciibacter superstes]